MSPNTGILFSQLEAYSLPQDERKSLIPVTRDLTAKERCEKQIKLYSPCGCGSGKKFKFCCKTNPPSK